MRVKSYLLQTVIRSGRCVLGAVPLFNAFWLVVIYKVVLYKFKIKIIFSLINISIG